MSTTIIDGVEITVETIFYSLASSFDPLYRCMPGVCQFHIGGSKGGDYYTTCIDSTFTVTAGVHRSPDCTVAMPDVDFVGWCIGRLRDYDLLAANRLRISGNPELLFSMVMMMTTGIPKSLTDTVRSIDELFRGRPRITDIERVSELSPSYLREASRTKTPFVLTGATSTWNASTWSLDYLKKKFGHLPFPVRKISESSPWVALFPLEIRRGKSRGTMLFGDFIDAVVESSATDPDIPHTDLMTLPDELLGELGPLPAFPSSALTQTHPEFFFSAAGAYTGVHRDFEDGASCVFLGRRRFRLWSPDQAPWLYAMPKLHPKFQACFLDARNPDPKTFPLFERAVPIEVAIDPGEVLFLPFGWFHDVSVLEHGATIRFDYPHDLHEHLARGPAR